MTNVEDLYKNFGILADAGENARDHVEAYQAILDGIKGSTPEKKLSCQFIPRFFKYFPTLSEAAIDAQLDLCEDEETPIRRQAIKSLPDFCAASTEHIPRITDILTQLLQQEDAAELAIVRNGLEKLIKKEPESALGGIFIQISVGDDVVREKAINFLTHITKSGGELMQDEKVGQFLLQEVKKVLSDVTGEEFTAFISMLTKVKSIASNPQNMADLITEQAELDKEFQPSEPESLDRLITCTRQATPFFLKGASSAKYLEYLFTKVLPVINDIISNESGDYKYEVLKLIADLSVYTTEENAKEYIATVYKLLIIYMPLPPSDTITTSESEEEVLQKLNFSFVECLMFAFHKLGQKNQEYLGAAESAELLKDFRQRLTYFGRMVQVYIKQLRVILTGKGKSELEEGENKIKMMALRTCNNVNSLIKDLLHSPPSYKSNITVSWKSKASPIQVSDETIEEKRKRAGITPISLENLPSKKERSAQNNGKAGEKFYKPPSERKGVMMDDDYVGRSKQYWRGYRGRGGRGFRGGRGSYRGSRQESYEKFLFR